MDNFSLSFFFFTELVMAMTPVLTSTPTKAKHSRKTKRKEQNEERTRITSGSEGDTSNNEYSTLKVVIFMNKCELRGVLQLIIKIIIIIITSVAFRKMLMGGERGKEP